MPESAEGRRVVSESAARKYKLQTKSGAELDVHCPLCQTDLFIATGPEDDQKRPGFRHVIVGMDATGKLMFLPVRFLSCDNCGFIVENLIAKGK